jgi:hypothetical protein
MEGRLLMTVALDATSAERARHTIALVRHARAFSAHLVGEPDPSGQVVAVGHTRPGTFVRVERNDSKGVIARAWANLHGRFRVTFDVGYGTTSATLVGAGTRRRPLVSSLTIDRADTAPPTIAIVSPAPGTTFTGEVTIDGRVADDQSGLGTLSASVDGGPAVPLTVQPDGSFSFVPFRPPLQYSNGTHTALFTVTNRSGGLSATASIAFSLDIPPVYQGPTLRIVDQASQPVLTLGDPGTAGNVNGFEGGTVIQQDGTYYLFTSEMIGNPMGDPMRLAIWTSPDGTTWTRATTLEQASGTSDGTDPRASLWSPIPVFDAAANVWNLFYVAYRSLPNTATEYLGNYDGEIVRAVSTQPGPGGIEGPYQDVGVVLQPGANSQSWEGLQGTDSFDPYQVGGQWYAFYGSGNAVQPNPFWRVGLAGSASISGPWTRLPTGNPVPLDPNNGVENPIVTHLPNGGYLAVFDALGYTDQIGYTYSVDGVHWMPAAYLQLDDSQLWTNVVRTPLGMTPDADGTYTLFYTGYYNIAGYGQYSGVGKVVVRLDPPIEP